MKPLKQKTSSLNLDNNGDVIEDRSSDISTFSSVHGNQANLSFLSKSSILYAVGFVCCMVVMELALEGANNAFPDLDSLPYAVTIFQFGACFFLPILLSKGEALSFSPKNVKQCIPYISLSAVVFGSTCLASMSVRYVSYPTKVVFKSAKLIPTMVVATFLQRGDKYHALDYAAAALLCAGAAGYGWGGGGPAGSEERANSWTGVTLLLISVFCDAFTPNIQQRLMMPKPTALPSTSVVESSPTHKKLSSLFYPAQGGLGLSASALMTNANGVGCVGLILFMGLSGSLFEAINAATTHPFLLAYLAVIGMALATAVLCYTRLIQESGSVAAVAVSTLRKVATVILSYVVYPKSISMLHVISGFLVLGGILLSSYSMQRSREKGVGTSRK